MLREPKKSGLRKLKTRRDPWQRFRERESKFLEKCIRQGKTLKSKVISGISLRSTPILVQLFMHQLLEMGFLWIRKPTSMKYSRRHFRRTQELKNFHDPSQTEFSSLRSACKNSNLNSIANFLEVK